MKNKQTKVLLVSPLPPPVGGIASWSVNILDFFKDKTNDFVLLHFNNALRRKRITDKSIFSRIVHGARDFSFQFSNIINIVNTQKPDIIHFTSSASLAILKDYLLITYLKKYKLKTILHFHFGRIPELKKKNNWEWKMIIRTISKVDKCIVIDSPSYKTLIDLGYNNVYALSNPIPFQLNLQSPASKLKVDRDEGVVLFVGHVVRDKGVYELVEAAISIDKVKELRLLGPFEEVVKNELLQIASKSNCRINFLGTKDRDEVLNEMKKCELFVLPSYSEGFPNVILEAMLCSCSIISTSVGAIPDMLSKNAGICVKPKSLEELSLIHI